jgi:hypothetical protein
MLGRKEVTDALRAMFMGPAGRPTVPVGSSQVSTGAIANMLGMLAQQAAEAFEPETEGEALPSYLLNERGEAVVDPALPEARAEALMSRLNEAAAMRSLTSARLRRRPLRSYGEAVGQFDEDADLVDFDELFREQMTTLGLGS